MAIDDAQMAKYRQKRQQFKPGSPLIQFYYAPELQSPYSTNTQSLPPLSVKRLANLSDDEFRGVVALSFLRVGLGMKSSGGDGKGGVVTFQKGLGELDSPKGRRASYQDLIMPFGDNRDTWVGKDDDHHGKSSCGLFIRGMWQLLGGGAIGPQPYPPTYTFTDEQGVHTVTRKPDLEFYSEYATNGIFDHILTIAQSWGALHEPPFGDPLQEVRLGDVFYVSHNDGQHIFSVAWLAEINDQPKPSEAGSHLRVYSVDGGNGWTGDGSPYSGQDPCMGIKNFERPLWTSGGNWDVGKYKVLKHIKLAEMKASFTEPWILPYTP